MIRRSLKKNNGSRKPSSFLRDETFRRASLVSERQTTVGRTGIYLFANTLWILIMSQPGFSSDPSSSRPQWAIAIHGGAGGDFNEWDEAKKMRRLDGLKNALNEGKKILSNGGTALDAIEATVRILEDDPAFNAGRGAVVTVEGKVELDASIMDGATKACGAVAGITNVKNPISLARLVMTKTKHVLLVTDGAEAFAKEQGVQLVDSEYFLSAVPPREKFPLVKDVSQGDVEAPSDRIGTVGCVCLDKHGNLAAGTSTGGTKNKLHGRVGDSPIVGAGTYASNESCAVSGTGIGEEFIRHSVAYDIAARMQYAQKSLPTAVDEVIRMQLKPDDGGVIAISKDGVVVMQHNTIGMNCGAADSHGRFDVMLRVE